MNFADLPIPSLFVFTADPDQLVTLKTTSTEARDATCAPGFCFTPRPNERVEPVTKG
jgi:hypothetical protein